MYYVDLPVTGLAIMINIQMARLTLNYNPASPASCRGAVHCAQNLTRTLQAMEAKLDFSLHHIIPNHNHPSRQLLPFCTPQWQRIIQDSK